MACCLTAPSHHLHHCWLIINKVLRQSPEINFTPNAQATILYNESENHTFKFISTSLRGQWVKFVTLIIIAIMRYTLIRIILFYQHCWNWIINRVMMVTVQLKWTFTVCRKWHVRVFNSNFINHHTCFEMNHLMVAFVVMGINLHSKGQPSLLGLFITVAPFTNMV